MQQRRMANASTPVYFTVGYEGEDLNSPESPYQGKGLVIYRKNPDGSWAFIQRDQDGKPRIGYLATEITAAEFKTWENRIKQVQLNPEIGYTDNGGHWMPGNLNNHILLATANKKLREQKESDFLYSDAMSVIDRVADAKLVDSGLRKEEYDARYAEAKEYQANPDDNKQWKYLTAMTYKGLTLAGGAEIVIANYEKAKANQSVIADLRMRKNLLKLKTPLADRRKIYLGILEELKSL